MGILRFFRENANWLIVGIILSFTSSFGQTFFISLFAGEVMNRFDLSHGQWGLIYTIGTAASALVMIWAGTLADQYRIGQLVPWVFGLLAVSSIAFAWNVSVWLLPVTIFALRLFGQGMSSQLMIVSMSRWFIGGRGRALAIASMGYAFGQAFLPYIFVTAKALISWQVLWLVAALISLLMIWPALALLRNERTPQSLAQSTVATGMDGRQWTRKDMLRHPLFWLLVPSILGPSAWNTALFFQQVHLAEVKGWTHAEFTTLIPIFTAVAVVTTFLSGSAIDRIGSGLLMALQGIPMVIGFALMFSSDSLLVATFAMGFIAINAGALATLPGSFAAEYYGTQYIGAIKSLWTAVMVLGSAIGPGISGWLIDQGLNFSQQCIAISGYFVVSVVLISVGVRRFKLQPS